MKREAEGEVARRYSYFHTIPRDNCSRYFHRKIRLGKGSGLDFPFLFFLKSVRYWLISGAVDHHRIPPDGKGETVGNT